MSGTTTPWNSGRFRWYIWHTHRLRGRCLRGFLWRCQVQWSGKESLSEVEDLVVQAFCHVEADECEVEMLRRKDEPTQEEEEEMQEQRPVRLHVVV